MDDHEKQKLKNYVLWLLSRQEYSRRDLTFKLKQKGATADFIDTLLDWCEQHSFIDEKRYCESFIRRHLAKLHGLKRIQAEAAGKGIERTLLETLIDEMEIDWYQQAQAAYNRKFSGITGNLEFKEKAKIFRYLSYRGFNHEQIEFAMHAEPSDE
ncbi:regulatory protein [Pseudoalteromonas ulvae UL12]|uniref:regulatory protein RecX n=1 Tax=Pseudoalteromonas ulvae TaxID=107327 RepID=UPI00186BA64A|nr:regulatory protein RecX [Pseudoalteromonas ulvae]MBE0363818.1 regulatory protein [Pseudoalteromonas ulvae UL12]